MLLAGDSRVWCYLCVVMGLCVGLLWMCFLDLCLHSVVSCVLRMLQVLVDLFGCYWLLCVESYCRMWVPGVCFVVRGWLVYLWALLYVVIFVWFGRFGCFGFAQGLFCGLWVLIFGFCMLISVKVNLGLDACCVF